jgi:hypothetical protein
MKSNGRRAGKLMAQIKQFQKAREHGESAMFLSDDYVIIDRIRFTQDAAELVETLYQLAVKHCGNSLTLDSYGGREEANALIILAKHNKVVIVAQDGTCVKADRTERNMQ